MFEKDKQWYQIYCHSSISYQVMTIQSPSEIRKFAILCTID